MLKPSFVVCFVFLAVIWFCDVNGERQKQCEKCVPAEKCTMYGDMSKPEQERWITENPCEGPEEEDIGVLFGFAPATKGDYVCCPYSNIWGVENASKNKQNSRENDNIRRPENNEGFQNIGSRHNAFNNDYNSQGIDNNNKHGYKQDNLHEKQNSHLNNDDRDVNDDVSYEQSKLPRNRWSTRRQGINRPNFNQMSPGQSRNQNMMNRPNEALINGPNFNSNNNPGFNNPNGNIGRNVNRPLNRPNFNGPSGFVPNVPNQRQNLGGQCSSLTSFPPTRQSGCCGLDLSHESMAGGKNGLLNRPSNGNQWTSPEYPRRFTRETPESIGISLDNRIAGGKETDLYQFPWTVLLKTTFDYGDRKSTFNCGGSLISSRYVLTAAHCVHEDNAKIDKVDVYLAEYDKRTFPRDCINSPEGRKCIDNILLQAENVVPHPYYDDARLQNDIALIRLQENVPYTEFTRPICLPPINIDNPNYSDLRLAVAGWGRNGSVPSEVKQSTVVNLVPQQQCSQSYPHLTKKHLCAAGRSGEDTCKGDSGGPLMMLYEGQYYVSGVVSGKRADAPCGTAIPSLYTNVFHYQTWIRSTIR